MKPKNKEKSNAASARGLRRFFCLAGLVESDWSAITSEGRDILKALPNTSLRDALWRNAMLRIQLDNKDEIWSHPYRILLNLVTDRPGIETSKLLLAFEAHDDGEVEYVRILKLADLATDEILTEIQVTPSSAANAVKILPSIAEQVGDISRSNGHAFPAGHVHQTEDALKGPVAGNSVKFEPSVPAAVLPENIAPLPKFGDMAPTAPDQAAAFEILKRRVIEHQKAVTRIAVVLAEHKYTTHANPYDCLGFKEHTGGLLIEVKTLDGTRSDERRQSEKALGQLRGYKFFNVPHTMKLPKLAEIVAYTAHPSDDAIHFMRDNAIFSTWPEAAAWRCADLGGNIANFSPDDLLSD